MNPETERTVARGPHTLALQSDIGRDFLEATADGIVVVDERGEIVLVNRRAEQMFGYERHTLVGCPVELLIIESVRDAHRTDRLRFQHSPAVRRMGTGAPVHACHRDGTAIPVEIDLSPIDTGGCRLTIAAIRDISARHESERAAEREDGWLAALSEIRSAALGDIRRQDLLDLVCSRVQELVTADDTAIAVPVGDGRDLRIASTSGTRADRVRGIVFAAQPVPGTPHSWGGSSHVSANLGDESWLDDRLRMPLAELGPVVVAQMRVGGTFLGVLFSARVSSGVTFDQWEIETIGRLAAETALAISLMSTRRDRARLQVLEDRTRIAADLHDIAIQRLFAAGMSLQNIASVTDGVVQERVEHIVNELDGTITDIRRAIFELHHTSTVAFDLYDEFLAIVDRHHELLGFRPELRIDYEPDPAHVAVHEQLVPVLNEALSNVARHAQAQRVLVELTVESDDIVLRITDDGVGIDDRAPRGQGLKNLEHRAREFGGECVIGRTPTGGTQVTWSAPTP